MDPLLLCGFPSHQSSTTGWTWSRVDIFQWRRELRESTKRWIAQQISIDGEGEDWVMDPRGLIKKSILTFSTKFILLLVHHCLSPTSVDNILTWDRAVLVAAMVAGFEIEFCEIIDLRHP